MTSKDLPNSHILGWAFPIPVNQPRQRHSEPPSHGQHALRRLGGAVGAGGANPTWELAGAEPMDILGRGSRAVRALGSAYGGGVAAGGERPSRSSGHSSPAGGGTASPAGALEPEGRAVRATPPLQGLFGGGGREAISAAGAAATRAERALQGFSRPRSPPRLQCRGEPPRSRPPRLPPRRSRAPRGSSQRAAGRAPAEGSLEREGPPLASQTGQELMGSPRQARPLQERCGAPSLQPWIAGVGVGHASARGLRLPRPTSPSERARARSSRPRRGFLCSRSRSSLGRGQNRTGCRCCRSVASGSLRPPVAGRASLPSAGARPTPCPLLRWRCLSNSPGAPVPRVRVFGKEKGGLLSLHGEGHLFLVLHPCPAATESEADAIQGKLERTSQ